MSSQNSAVINLRKCCKPISEAAVINGYRNAVFLPGVGRYKGTWKNNLREGLGTLTSKNGVTYEGNWLNDKRHGYGLLQRKLNAIRFPYTPIYDGDWKFDKRDGDGTSYYENGFYEGQWTHGVRNGLGIMSFHDGSYYIGQWNNDLYDGIGAHYDANGETLYKGYFRNGKKCGEGTLNYLLKSKIQKGIWMDGSCVTSILQSDEGTNPLKECMPEIGLATPVTVILESLQSKYAHKEMIKSREKRMEHFNCL